MRASAKVNLSLEVLGKRPDGYHEIVTVMQAVDLYDRLTLEAASTLSLRADEPDLPTDERNLIMRAARLLKDAAKVEAGARIELSKRIPVAAGLGGGSSDAAATLWGLNRLWKLRWPRARLMELAVGIGMDVPFFLGNGPALGTGRGEHLKPLGKTGWVRARVGEPPRRAVHAAGVRAHPGRLARRGEGDRASGGSAPHARR